MSELTYLKNTQNGNIISRYGSAVAVPTENGLKRFSPVVLLKMPVKPIKRVSKVIKENHTGFWIDQLAPQGA
jgi:hypothetical protein